MTEAKKALSVALATSILAACGGGGGGSSESAPTPTVRTGTFVDSPVAGLAFSTPSRNGVTNSQGEFQYLEGEQVTFSIGNTTLGVATGAETVTPFSLLGIAPLKKEARIIASFNQDTVSSFERALNIAMLLQNLDQDGIPENGIDLGEANEVMKNDQIDLVVKSSGFLNQTLVRSVKRRLGVTHSRDLLESVKHLYDNLEVQIESSQVANVSASFDQNTSNSSSFDYDDNGNVTEERIDRNGDGEPDVIKRYTYDDNGNVTDIVNANQGISESMTYDGNSNLLTRQTTTPGGSSLERYNYNANNQIRRFELDKDNDGGIDITTLYTYVAGELTGYTTDRDGDGNPDATATYVYENGRVATFVEDKDNDGTPELIIAYSYDARGNRQSYNINVSSDGYPSAPGKFTYDEQDNVTRYELDIDLDGTYDYIEAYTYNSQKQRTSYYRDNTGDGLWNTIIQYKYNEDGQRILMAEDNDGNGIADKVWKGQYQPAIVENAWDRILGQG